MRPEVFVNIRFLILTCFHLTNSFGEEIFSFAALYLNTKWQIFISHFVQIVK